MKVIGIILVFLFLVSCKNENLNKKNKTVEGKANSDSPKIEIKDSLSANGEDQKYKDDPMFKKLFILTFYDNYRKFEKDKDLTLVINQVDTSINFNFQLKENRFSNEVEKFHKDNKSLFSRINNVTSSAFYLKEIKLIEDNYYLGIFAEYFGFERILYGYGKLILKDKILKIVNLYYSLERTSIGSITFDLIIKLDNESYCILGDKNGEGYQNISLYYFPKNYRNKTYILDKCEPSSEANPHGEKLEYSVDYKNNHITIKKLEIDRDKEIQWRKISENRYNIFDIAKQLKR